jgi:hypothetical protein
MLPVQGMAAIWELPPHHYKQETKEGKLNTTWTKEKLSRMTFNKISSSWGSKSAVCQTICMEMFIMSCDRNIKKKIFSTFESVGSD